MRETSTQSYLRRGRAEPTAEQIKARSERARKASRTSWAPIIVAGTEPTVGRAFHGMLRVDRGFRFLPGRSIGDGLPGHAFEKLEWADPLLLRDGGASSLPFAGSLVRRSFSMNSSEKSREIKHAIDKARNVDARARPLLAVFDRRHDAEHKIAGLQRAGDGTLEITVESTHPGRARSAPSGIGSYTVFELCNMAESPDEAITLRLTGLPQGSFELVA